MQFTCAAMLGVALAGCGSNDQVPLDAPPDAPIDAPPDAPADAACERTLLVGGMDVAAQGWSMVTIAPATVSYGADDVQLATSTGASGGGQLLLTYPGAVSDGVAFRLEVVMQVESVNAHGQFDSAAAILGSFTPPFGTNAERSQMIYLDAGAIGWADNTESHAVAVTDGAYHTYVLAVAADGAAQVTFDGIAALARTGFATNGTIAIGDQSNDQNLDATTRIKSVRLLCP